MNYAELAERVSKISLRDPFSRLTPRKRKKRWNLLMKHLHRDLYRNLGCPTPGTRMQLGTHIIWMTSSGIASDLHSI